MARDNTVYRGTRLRVTFNDPLLPRGGAPSQEGRGEGRGARPIDAHAPDFLSVALARSDWHGSVQTTPLSSLRT